MYLTENSTREHVIYVTKDFLFKS